MDARRSGRSGLVGKALLSALGVACAFMAFGLSGSDDAAVRAFDEAATSWQTDPDFRRVAMDYCVLGSRAVRTRLFGIHAGGVVMAVRSIPGVPSRFAVNPTSQLHYERFAQGPLCAYLHLCSEQSVPDFAGVVEKAATPAADPDPRSFLDAYHMDIPLCTDAGALQSTSSLLRDVDGRRPLTVRENIGPLLAPHIAGLARDLQVPEDPQAMTPAQQQAVLDRLDARVRRDDPELWRTKQLSDFCGGVWAQVFGPPYHWVTRPVIVAHAVAWPGLVALAAWTFYRRGRRRAGREAGTPVAVGPEPTGPPPLRAPHPDPLPCVQEHYARPP
jgi:hypothetical protein